MYISSGDSYATIDVTGSYMRRLTLDGRVIIKETDDLHPTHGGMAILAPYANRIKDGKYTFQGKNYHFVTNAEGNSIHGFARRSMFKIVRKTRAKIAVHSLLSDPGYPGKLDLLVTYVINSNSLEVRVRAENPSSSDLPFQLGFHPYFLFDKSWSIKSDGPMMELEYENSYFPNGKGKFMNPDALNSTARKRLDNCFWIDGEIAIDLGSHQLKLSRSGFPFVVVYNGIYSQSKSIAIEPMSAPTNCFNNGIGLKVLPSRGFETYSFTIELQNES